MGKSVAVTNSGSGPSSKLVELVVVESGETVGEEQDAVQLRHEDCASVCARVRDCILPKGLDRAYLLVPPLRLRRQKERL